MKFTDKILRFVKFEVNELISNGVWNNKASGLAEYENIWYYVKDGKIDRSFTGEITLEDTIYSIVDGVWQQ